MDGDRTVSLLADPDQWARCRHDGIALSAFGGIQLTWDETPPDEPGGRSEPSGLAFDRWGGVYRSHPAENRIDALTGERAEQAPGAPFDRPRGLAVDPAQRLYAAESDAVAVVDLWAGRLLTRIALPHPVDLAAHRDRVYVLSRDPAGISALRGCSRPAQGPPLVRPQCPRDLRPHRLAVHPDGALLVLWASPDGTRALITTPEGRTVADVPGATDLDVTPDGVLVVARRPGHPFLRYRDALELEPLRAPGYDGGALSTGPDGVPRYTTPAGAARVGGLAARYRATGRTVTYRLDSGAYRTRWGRVFLDACVPRGTGLRLLAITTDDDEQHDALPWTPPARNSRPVHRSDLTPPFPSRRDLDTAGEGVRPLIRPTGREAPWEQIPADDRFETYELHVHAPRGRYLWLVLDLSGTQTATPRVRSLRAERPGHRLLDLLPRSWSRDEESADFLQRMLAPAEGLLHELDERAARRHRLLDPAALPQEALAWLAGFAGLTLDRRWPESARRTLVAEAFRLFRGRGTLASLRELLGIYLGYEPVILEDWRGRGVPGGVLGREPGDPPATGAAAVLGRMRLAGTVGHSATAHRFHVLIPAGLTAEQLDVVRTILDLHKPAHTDYEICELVSGARVGRGMRLGATSTVGPGAGWGPAVTGRFALGADGVLGGRGAGGRA